MSSQTAGHSEPQTPAQRINRVISERGLTNLEVAYHLGVAEKTVWRWRKGDMPRARYARKLAEMFGGDWSDYTEPDLKEAV